MRFKRSESGEVSATCEKCGRIYYLSSEWDSANLDWHECTTNYDLRQENKDVRW